MNSVRTSPTASARDERAGAVATPPRLWPRWLVASGLLMVVLISWSWASPMPSGPDEPAQIIKAAAVAHAELIGSPTVPPHTGVKVVTVPRTIENMMQRPHGCYYGQIKQPGGCATPIVAQPGSAQLTTYVAQYPPVYYFLVGLPSVVSNGAWTLMAMRAVSAILSALVLGFALAAAATWAQSRLLLAATAFVMTPGVFYLGAVVNPSGLEISAAIAAWVVATIIVTSPPGGTDGAGGVAGIGTKAYWALAVLCGVLAWMRPLSFGWVVLILAVTAALRPRRARAVLTDPRFRLPGVVLALVTLGAAGWVAVFKSYQIESFPLPAGTTTVGAAEMFVDRTSTYVGQGIGGFGSPEFTVPEPIQWLWIAGFGAFLLLTWLSARRRDAWIVLAWAALSFAIIPFAITISHAKTNGLAWQGRYGYPLFAGVPILAAAVLPLRATAGVTVVTDRLRTLLPLTLAVGWLFSLYWVLRRYSVGLGARYNIFAARTPDYWHPPVAQAITVVVNVAAVAALCFWLNRRLREVPGDVGSAFETGYENRPNG